MKIILPIVLTSETGRLGEKKKTVKKINKTEHSQLPQLPFVPSHLLHSTAGVRAGGSAPGGRRRRSAD